MISEKENVDAAELARFESVADRWWDMKGDFRALHHINAMRLNYIKMRAKLDGKKVLDLGCGGGILSEAMAAEGARVSGVDASEAPLIIAKKHAAKSGFDICYECSTPENYAKKNPESFDAVVCMEVLEHVPNPVSIVFSCKKLLKPGGTVFFSTLNRNLKSFLLAIIGAEYVMGLLPKGTHQYKRFIKPSELREWGKKAGLIPKNLSGMHYNPFSRRCTLGGSSHVNYLMYFKRP